jgi:hypothetical protein
MKNLSQNQLTWCAKVADHSAPFNPCTSQAEAFFFLQSLSKRGTVDVTIRGDDYILYFSDISARGNSIAEALAELIVRIYPDPDPDPVLIEHLINTLAPGHYPTYMDKLDAAIRRAEAEAVAMLDDVGG